MFLKKSKNNNKKESKDQKKKLGKSQYINKI